ncbi:hypothetical protein [Mycobacterium leprae]|nr:hypothetical protein [Mycobacterium leprae]
MRRNLRPAHSELPQRAAGLGSDPVAAFEEEYLLHDLNYTAIGVAAKITG